MKESILAFLAATLIFGMVLYFTDKPNCAQFYGDFRLDRRYMGKPCDAWVYAEPVDMNEFDKAIASAEPGSTIYIHHDGSISHAVSCDVPNVTFIGGVTQ